ncbi:hypothetical protein GCM10007425_05120 [Lysinibacillus alkalisoli]|uniref:Uncharacterized protein n=1 Tax=Lysinibacillus alkalisoli TaxID=1911548 RepID=A0A917FXX0_9BACI|nr:hypothetical protein [Lysinibacillus alkalisoli]GGG13793.1 hypothetical protein GCM10007425_05120 [Lysinibacillus alkalisoli]
MRRNPSVGKGWLVIGALFIIVGFGLIMFRNASYDKQIVLMKEQCKDEGGELIVKELGNFFTRNYDIKCDK